MDSDDLLSLWQHAQSRLLDVRLITLTPGQEWLDYRTPASFFLYQTQGNVQLSVDEHMQPNSRFYIQHGRKGSHITIRAHEASLIYLILYRVSTPTSKQRLTAKALDTPYAFVPSQPLPLLNIVEQMYEYWHSSTDSGRLRAHGFFLQWVAEVLDQAKHAEPQLAPPDLVAQALHILHHHYRESLTMETLASKLHCSEGHLSRLFRSKLNTSPIHYAGRLRAHHTVKLLLNTNASLQQIAEFIGYPDAHSLSRSFKRYIGLSPDQFRKGRGEEASYQDLPCDLQAFVLPDAEISSYTVFDKDYQYHIGSDCFVKQRMKGMALAMSMSLALIMQACTGTSAPTEESVGQIVPTRIVSTVNGDVEIPAEPKRVAADQYLGQLLKLGIVPIGVRSFMLEEASITLSGLSEETIAGIEDLGGFPLNPEKLSLMEPDLIIGSIDQHIETYEKIAPTVFIPYWEALSTSGPLEKFRRISEVFGKEDIAEQWITEYKLQIEQAKARIDGVVKPGETVSIIQVANKTLYVLAAEGGNYGSSTIYEMLALPPTAMAQQMEEGFELISLEVLPDYVGDHIFVYGADDDDSDIVLDSSIWKGLPAVQQGNVYYYGSSTDGWDEFVMEDPFSLEKQLETITSLLEKNKTIQ